MEDFKRQRIDVNKLPPHVLEKWSKETLAEGFVPFPKKLLRCLHQLFSDTKTMEELAVLLAIVDFKRPNLTHLPSRAYLSFLAGLPEDRFETAMDRLSAKGYVNVTGDLKGLQVSLEGFMLALEQQAKG